MVLSIFCDESSDGQQERVFSISGVCGSASEWNKAIEGWKGLTKGEEFHAVEWERAGRDTDISSLAEFLGQGILAGFAVSLDLRAFKEVFPNNIKDTGYYQCFSKVLQIHSSCARQWNRRVAIDPSCGDPFIELEFTFDHRKQSESNAETLYSAFINQPEWKNTSILSVKVAFDCRSNPRIQMADLVAREAMKEFDRKLNTEYREKRPRITALERLGAFRFIELDKEYCLKLRDDVRKSTDEPGYWAWLKNTGRVQHGKPQDNYGNRFDHYIYLINKEALGINAELEESS